MRAEEWDKLISITLEANCIMVTDSSGIIVWVNDEFSRLTGYSREEAIGNNPKILKSGKHNADFYRRIWSTISKGKVWSGDIINNRKDGTRYSTRMEIIPVKTEEEHVTHYVAINREDGKSQSSQESDKQRDSMLESIVPLMTELKDVTAALEHARSEMHAMLNATSEAIMLFSIDNKMLSLNRAFGQFFSIDPQEVTGNSFHNLNSHWEKVFGNFSGITEIIDNAMNDRTSEKRESLTQIWPQKRELEIYSAPVENVSQEYLGQLFVFRDVTREREVERMKSEFVSLVSHEFRTPLTSIRGYTEMMLEGDAGDLNDEQTDFLKTVFRNATHLTEIVNDLLIVSRLEAGAIKLKLGCININDIIEDVIALLQPQIDAKQQNLKLRIPKNTPDALGDAQRVNQILLNLLSNAYKYTPANGSLSVNVSTKQGFISIDVKDSGIGLSKSELEQLFTKFYRAENPATIKAGGTGLGLWITRSLVEMHGGKISVVSKPGKGSTFTFTLKVYKE
jgi:PAS domain S-box-containing protein